MGDLGASKLTDNAEAIVKSYVGTKSYMSPEVRQREYSLNTDVWFVDDPSFQKKIIFGRSNLYILELIRKKRSLGCVVYELIALDVAFPNGVLEDRRPDLENLTIFSSVLNQ